MKKRLALLGPGRVGQAVCRLLKDAGHEICAVIGRDGQRTREAADFIGAPETATTDLCKATPAEIVLVAVPDDHIGTTAAGLRRQAGLAPGTVLIHFSGLHRASILLGEDGPPLGALSIHPLQTFATASAGVSNLPGTPCSVEGETALHPLAFDLVRDLGGTHFPIKGEQKALYHTSACLASNYFVTLAHDACTLMTRCGVEQDQAFALLLPLLRGTFKNLETLGPVQALTGPISRGDDRTVQKHLEALEALPEGLRRAYKALGMQTLDVASEKGTLNEAGRQRILQILKSGE